MIAAVIFDMDGLLLDSEVYWEQARSEYCAAFGCLWSPADELTVKGNNSPEWAERIRLHCRLDLEPREIIDDVSERMKAQYQQHLPLLPGATSVVEHLASKYPLGLASSSPASLIDFALTEAGIRRHFQVIVSADDVGKGKPSPDVFLVTANRLGFLPEAIAVFEDSTAGIRAARAAGMHVIAVPNPHYPPAADALLLADAVLPTLLDFQDSLLTA